MITLEEKAREYLAIAMEYMRRGISAQENGIMETAKESYTRGVSVCEEGRSYLSENEGAWVEKYNQAMTKTQNSMTTQLEDMKKLSSAPAPARSQPIKPQPNPSNAKQSPSQSLERPVQTKPKLDPKPDPKPDTSKKSGIFGFLFNKKDTTPANETKPDKSNDSRKMHSQNSDLRRTIGSRPEESNSRSIHSSDTSRLRATIGSQPSDVQRSVSNRGGEERGGYGSNCTNNRPAAPRNPAPKKTDLLKRHEEKYINAILNDVINPSDIGVTWDDVTGLEVSKQHLQEAVVWPMLRPDLFSGLRTPPKGVLLFGPPGNGKTLLAKAVACESKATFFSISASSIVSKFLGDGEKMVKALFACAEHLSPSVVFIDEVDSLLASRGEEHEAMRRIKTEFLVQMDGVGTSTTAQVLVLAATNRPQDIDTACLRRFTKRVLIPLPCRNAREAHLSFLSHKDPNTKFKLGKSDLRKFSELTDGFSFSDLTALIREAAIIPLRKLGSIAVNTSDIPPVTIADIVTASKIVRPSATKTELAALNAWSSEYGTAG